MNIEYQQKCRRFVMQIFAEPYFVDLSVRTNKWIWKTNIGFLSTHIFVALFPPLLSISLSFNFSTYFVCAFLFDIDLRAIQTNRIKPIISSLALIQQHQQRNEPNFFLFQYEKLDAQ